MNRQRVALELDYAVHLLEEMDGRKFELVRHEDVSGVSGTGVVADGIHYPELVILRWRPPYDSTAVWPSLDKMLGAHGHGGKTVVHWLDEEGA